MDSLERVKQEQTLYPDRVVGRDGVVIEINDDAQRLFATMLMKLTEMAIEVGRISGNEGLAAFHGALGYLSDSNVGADIQKRAADLRAWAETTGLVAI